jgi:hypothetical protein
MVFALCAGHTEMAAAQQSGTKYYVTSGQDSASDADAPSYFEGPETQADDILQKIEPATGATDSASQDEERKGQISKAARHHAQSVAASCPGSWETQSCLQSASDTFLTTAALYAEDLDKNGQSGELENIKAHCAASTAATRLDDLPAYAMRSAFVECVNEIYDMSERTKIKPDIELYQLMVMSVLCLDKDPRCSVMEDGLKKTVSRY